MNYTVRYNYPLLPDLYKAFLDLYVALIQLSKADEILCNSYLFVIFWKVVISCKLFQEFFNPQMINAPMI